MSKPILFKGDESDTEVEIKTNNEYATSYNKWRQKEELNRLKTKYGNTPRDLSDEDDSSTSDDDEGTELPETFEKNFFKTLACLKKKDPKIYDNQTEFFQDASIDPKSKPKSKKIGSLFLKDYEKKVIGEAGKFEDSPEEIDEDEDEDPRSNSPTYIEEQRRLKESLKTALNDEEENEENWGGMFKKREMTQTEQEQQEDDYKKWLKGNKEKLDNKTEENELKPLKEYWDDPSLDKTEVFLKDYLLNKRYLDAENKDHIPTYEEIIHDSDEGLSEDEKAIEKQEEFEIKYNFRFEAPDKEFIKRYPRTMEQSVRKTDDRRKDKRAEIKQRKEDEKRQKKEELKQLKVYKRKEIEEKIKKLKEITGNNEMAFQDIDLDADFDPDDHDKRMHDLFNDQYYHAEEGDKKPEFSDLEEELGPWKDTNVLHCEDDDFNMDCDYDPSMVKKDKKEKKKRNRPGKKSKEEEIDEIPVDKNDTRYEEYMDELYKLDYEDIIGDIPCRFKYREVVPNDFGLTIEEILLAKERELNQWCSLKKATQHRPEHVEKYEVIAYKHKARNEETKRRILPSIYQEYPEESEFKTKKPNTTATLDHSPEDSEQIEEDKIPKDKKLEESTKIKKKKRKNSEITTATTAEDTNIEENGINLEIPEESTKSKKNKLKNSEITTTTTAEDTNIEENGINLEIPEESTKSKKKKRKNSEISTTIEDNQIENIEMNGVSTENMEENNKINKKKRKNSDNVELNPKIPEEANKIKKMKRQNSKSTENQINPKIPDQANKIKKKKQKTNLIPKANASNSNTTEPPNKTESLENKTENLSRRQRKNRRKAALPKPTKEPVEETKKTNKKRKLSQSNSKPNKKQKSSKPSKTPEQPKQENKLDLMTLSDERLRAYGFNPKKFRNKLKYKNQNKK